MPQIPGFLKRLVGLKPKVGLVLGGGVARGLAHIGVLKVLHAHGLRIDYIAATSAGSLIAALYAGGLLPFQMERIGKKTSWQRLLQLTFSRRAPFKLSGLRRFIVHRIGDKTFDQLKIPLRVIATDLMKAESVVLKEGKVADAVCASATFPGAFMPVEINGKLLVDGGVFDNLPVAEARAMGAEVVIAIDVVPVEELRDFPPDVIKVAGRAIDLMLSKMSEKSRQEAEVVIRPKIDETIGHLDLNQAPRLIKAGEEAAQRALEEIEQLIPLSSAV